MVHIAESTVGRRYAGWFIKNTERAQKILDDLKNMPLPVSTKVHGGASNATPASEPATQNRQTRSTGPKVAWGGVKVAAWFVSM